MSEQNRKLSYQYIYELRHSEFSIRDIIISPDSRTLFTTDSVTVKLWRLDTGGFLEEIDNQGEGLCNALAISPNGQILAQACGEYSIDLWDLQSRKHLDCLQYITEFEHDYTSVAFCADNVTLISGGSAQTDTWNIHTGERSVGTNTLGRSLALSPNGHIIVGDLGRVEFSDIPRSRPPHRIEKLLSCVATVAITKDGKTCAGGLHDGRIIFWDWQTYAELLTINAHTSNVKSIAFSDDGQTLVSCSKDKLIKFWNVSNGQLLGSIEGHSGRVYGVAWSRDGKFLASYDSDKNIKVWRVSLS